MAIITTVKYKCDCCGVESENADFNNGRESGKSTIKIKGGHGSMAYNGDWGGANHDMEKLVCFNCSDKIRGFILTLGK